MSPAELSLFVTFLPLIMADMSLLFRCYAAVPPLLMPLFFGSESRDFREIAADPNVWKLFTAGAPLRFDGPVMHSWPT